MKDFTTGNEGKLIFNFAIPMLVGNVFQQLYQVADSAIVGRFIGTEALSAVGNSMPVIFMLVSLMIGIGIGSTIIISQYFGAKNYDGVKKASDTMFVIMFFAAIILTIIGIASAEPILKLINVSDAALPMAKQFLIIYLSGIIFLFGFHSISALLRGIGDSMTPLYFLIVSNIVNIGLAFLFVGYFRWGIAGAAWATVIAQALTFIAGVIYLNKTHSIVSLSLRNIQFDKEVFKKSIQIGLPTGLQQTFVALGMMALFSIANKFGDHCAAAFRAAGNIDSLAMLPAMNFAAGLSTFVAQNIGANKLDRVRNGLKATLIMSSLVCVFLSLIIIIFGRSMMTIFTTDPEVIRMGREYLVIVSSFYLAFNVMFTVQGFLRGAGDTLIPMFLTLFSLWLIRIPVAYFLSDIYDESGIWWSIPVAWISGTIFSYAYYRTGRWKRKVVIKPATARPIDQSELEIPLD
jgi:putative MATE family efflux protein